MGCFSKIAHRSLISLSFTPFISFLHQQLKNEKQNMAKPESSTTISSYVLTAFTSQSLFKKLFGFYFLYEHKAWLVTSKRLTKIKNNDFVFETFI